MLTGFMYIALAVCLLLCACTKGELADEISFDALLGAALTGKMDYMDPGAHQKRAPTTSSRPLVGLGSNYRRHRKSFL